MRWRWLVVLLAGLAVTLVAIGGPGYRLGLWGFGTGFTLMRWAVYVGAAAVVLCLAALLIHGAGSPSRVVVALALAAAGLAVYFPLRFKAQAGSVPPIHDISTDTENPPRFVAVLPLRANAANPATYGGPQVAGQQHQAYPDIQPLQLTVAPAEAFAAARAAALGMGWDLVAADSSQGRIEATATTLWYGFKDDIVVRLRPDAGGTRVDVRSVSRVGRSDLGTNARRIRRYLDRLRAGGQGG